MGSSIDARGAWLAVTAAALMVCVPACGRSPIDLAPPSSVPIVVERDAASVDPVVEPAVEPPVDAPVEVAPDVLPDLPPEAAPDLPPELRPELPPPPVDAPVAERPPVEAGPVCHPQPETCNGVDDNCDGNVDENLPAIPCPGGGNRYCVSGRYSECPRRCETCVPGSARECFTTLCTFWGSETCTSDGRSFGACKEGKPPAACAGAANGGTRTRALEDCCLAQGLCCVDEFDINGNGDRTEMLGRCDTVVCGP